MLAGRRIVLAVTGGVAAYKAGYLARRLVEAGADVRSIMSGSAHQFVGAQTLAAITGNPPISALFGSSSVSPHTEIARWAEAIVVAPTTAGLMGRLASGISDDLVTATLLAARCPVLLAPAMHTEMWEHPATQRNLATLVADGYAIVGPETGALAGGDEGPGRMAEPEEIMSAIEGILSDGDLVGWSVLVSAGGTREAIDPVRYLGNRSSGKMGTAIALEAWTRGAEVTLVTTAPAPSRRGLFIVEVETADEMAGAVWEQAPKSDVVVLAAAVADFKPKMYADEKLRRVEGPPDLVLEPTPDILAGVASQDSKPFLVGFAAEAGSPQAALPKAKSKGVDLLVANDITDEGSGFGADTNRVTLIEPDGSLDTWDLMPKREVARRIWDRIIEMRGGTEG
jgi:phosphopantothenoylcysteine decarboxylase/phosphopantothenate--cysteine ligase